MAKFGFTANQVNNLPPTVSSAAGPLPPGNTGIASIGVPGTLLTNILNYLGGGLGSVVNTFTAPPQYFVNVPFPNNQPCLYRLTVTSTSGPSSANIPFPVSGFTFPLTPAAISYQNTNMVTFYDVRGDATTQNGVQRIVDQYGQNLPIITIAGTTGFQFHSLDGFQWSGRISMAQLQDQVTLYHQLVQLAIQQGTPNTIPTMRFYDGYRGEVFKVVPLGPEAINMDNSRPIIQFYNLVFLVTSIESNPEIEGVDPLSLALIQFEGNLVLAVRSLLQAGTNAFQQLILNPAGLIESIFA